jgi:hypothetical protein
MAAPQQKGRVEEILIEFRGEVARRKLIVDDVRSQLNDILREIRGSGDGKKIAASTVYGYLRHYKSCGQTIRFEHGLAILKWLGYSIS